MDGLLSRARPLFVCVCFTYQVSHRLIHFRLSKNEPTKKTISSEKLFASAILLNGGHINTQQYLNWNMNRFHWKYFIYKMKLRKMEIRANKAGHEQARSNHEINK